jgi:hypothetical protein
MEEFINKLSTKSLNAISKRMKSGENTHCLLNLMEQKLP